MRFDSLGWLDIAQGYDISGNSFDRSGVKATHLVIHGTAGGSDAHGTMAYMGANGVSTHFAISTDGTIVQGVNCNKAAWANAPLNAPRLNFAHADINPNLWTVSVEFCKPDITNQVNITDAQKQSGFALIKMICETYGIPKKQGDGNGGIISHADINSVDRARCPGTFPWSDLMAFLKGGTPVAPNKNQIIAAQQEWGSTASSFPNNVSPSYTTGIAAAWRDRYYRGQQLGGPTSDEVTTDHDGKSRIDWGGNTVIFQYFRYGHAEWSNGSCRFFDGRSEII